MVNSAPPSVTYASKLSVAPMMDWTDRHCRFFHRLISNQALLYTEMVTSPALVRGGALYLLDYNPEEQPVALQLGGSDPVELGQAAQFGARAGYDEINLNCGCPSDRVQSGAFGAVLMQSPDLVAEASLEGDSCGLAPGPSGPRLTFPSCRRHAFSMTKALRTSPRSGRGLERCVC